MALMTWNSNFVTGIDIIDEQHQWLIDLINAAAPYWQSTMTAITSGRTDCLISSSTTPASTSRPRTG